MASVICKSPTLLGTTPAALLAYLVEEVTDLLTLVADILPPAAVAVALVEHLHSGDGAPERGW